MSLTRHPGPLSGGSGAPVNYRIEGPQHRLLLHDFPRRVRAELGGQIVMDTERGKLLHETGLLPMLYVPAQDVRQELLEKTDHATRCPFKGVASYWSVRVGDRVAENAVWGYLEPNPEAPWLRGHLAFYWEAMDAWYDEDEQVYGSLRDPFHRVDVRESARPIRVLLDGEVIAECKSPKLLSETGLPNRLYIPADEVRRDLLIPSDRQTVCPYKGTASYWSLRTGDRVIEDVAWSYPDPLEEAIKVRDHLCFDHEALTVETASPRG